METLDLFVVLAAVAGAGVLWLQRGTAGAFDPVTDTVGDTMAGHDAIAPSLQTPATVDSFAQAIAHAEGFGIPGAIPTRANNPGDLVIPGWIGPTLGAEGISVFVSEAEGWRRLHHQLDLIRTGRSRVYRLNMTIAEMAGKWTATEVGSWALNVSDALGVSPDTQIGAVLV